MTPRELYLTRWCSRRQGWAAVLAAVLALMLSAPARAATITVTSLADTGTTGSCVLRDAINAANTETGVDPIS